MATPEVDPTVQVPQVMPGFSASPASMDWLSPQKQVPRPAPPVDEADFFGRVAGWKDALTNFGSTDAGRAALLRFGAAALQPIQPGQTFGGHLAGSIMQGVQGHQAITAQQRAQAIEDQRLAMEQTKMGLQARQVGVQEGELSERKIAGASERTLRLVQENALKRPDVKISEAMRKRHNLPAGVETWGQWQEYTEGVDRLEQNKSGGLFGSGGSSQVQNREHLIKILTGQSKTANPTWTDEQHRSWAEGEALKREKTSMEKTPMDTITALAGQGVIDLSDPQLMQKIPQILRNLDEIGKQLPRTAVPNPGGANPPGAKPAKAGATPPASKGEISLGKARTLAAMKGKTDAEIRALAQKLGYSVKD